MVRILVAAAILGASPLPVRGQTPDARAQARAMFVEGASLADRGDWAQAADRFRRALDLYPSAATRFNLATSLARLGRLVEATEHARAVVAETAPGDRARAGVEALLREIEPRLGYLTIRLEGDATGVEILIDRVSVPMDRLRSPIPVDPRRHAVVARRGQTEVSQEVNVDDGGSAHVTLSLPAPATPGPHASSGPEPAPAPPPEEVHLEIERPQPEEPDRIHEDRQVDSTPSTKPRWLYFAASAGLLGTGLALDLAPPDSQNTTLEWTDVVPVGFYTAAAVAAALGIL